MSEQNNLISRFRLELEDFLKKYEEDYNRLVKKYEIAKEIDEKYKDLSIEDLVNLPIEKLQMLFDYYNIELNKSLVSYRLTITNPAFKNTQRMKEATEVFENLKAKFRESQLPIKLTDLEFMKQVLIGGGNLLNSFEGSKIIKKIDNLSLILWLFKNNDSFKKFSDGEKKEILTQIIISNSLFLNREIENAREEVMERAIQEIESKNKIKVVNNLSDEEKSKIEIWKKEINQLELEIIEILNQSHNENIEYLQKISGSISRNEMKLEDIGWLLQPGNEEQLIFLICSIIMNLIDGLNNVLNEESISDFSILREMYEEEMESINYYKVILDRTISDLKNRFVDNLEEEQEEDNSNKKKIVFARKNEQALYIEDSLDELDVNEVRILLNDLINGRNGERLKKSKSIIAYQKHGNYVVLYMICNSNMIRVFDVLKTQDFYKNNTITRLVDSFESNNLAVNDLISEEDISLSAKILKDYFGIDIMDSSFKM